ncbi:hypothetical protein KQX54_019750 [Cotesia glomerata]|uniref:Uncharacterized protein n=1 Tax=Cotesia glomerata TaxID=32391 RepID=A0AAV7IXB3_COTGL|nr:hypothetical protein KQX54_019750 [Cotesia glomerata]
MMAGDAEPPGEFTGCSITLPSLRERLFQHPPSSILYPRAKLLSPRHAITTPTSHVILSLDLLTPPSTSPSHTTGLKAQDENQSKSKTRSLKNNSSSGSDTILMSTESGPIDLPLVPRAEY